MADQQPSVMSVLSVVRSRWSANIGMAASAGEAGPPHSGQKGRAYGESTTCVAPGVAGRDRVSEFGDGARRLTDRPQTRRFLGGRQPLWGRGVTSSMAL